MKISFNTSPKYTLSMQTQLEHLQPLHPSALRISPLHTQPVGKPSQPRLLCAALIGAAFLSACAAPLSAETATVATPTRPPVASMSGPVLSASTNTEPVPSVGSGMGMGTGESKGSTRPTGASLMRDVAVEIGDAACDADAQCRTVGVGSKACGGPEGYLAWSSKVNGQGTRLLALAAAHSTERERENERSGMRSNCSVTPDPGAVCKPRASDGVRTCQTVQRARSSGAV